MDTITFTGQLLLATQNDTCRALSVIINNTSESCCNGCDVAIAGIICGAVVLVALFAKIILLSKFKIDAEWKTLQSVTEKKKCEQEHNWEIEKERNTRKELLEDRRYKRDCEKDERDFKKKHEYQQILLDYTKENSELSREDMIKYQKNQDDFFECIKKICENKDEEKDKIDVYRKRVKEILDEGNLFDEKNYFVSKIISFIEEFNTTSTKQDNNTTEKNNLDETAQTPESGLETSDPNTASTDTEKPLEQ